MDNFFIHKFKTNNNYYFYDVNTNQIIKTDKTTYLMLNKTSDAKIINKNTISKIKNHGLLKADRINEISYPLNNLIIEYYLQNKIGMICLEVTQQCNFRCKYCAYSGGYKNRSHSIKRMDFDLAKRCIDFLFSHSKDLESISISFYGGEPLLEFELIKNCIKYTKAHYEGKDIHFNITTNGSLLNDANITYFIQNNVDLMISLDGPKYIHDKNRCFINGKGTFDKIFNNLLSFEQTYPEYLKKITFSTVLDPTNDFGCVNEFFLSYDFLKNATNKMSIISELYSKKKVSYSDNFINESKYEHFKLYLSKLNKLNKSHISPLIKNRMVQLFQYDSLKRKPTCRVPQKTAPSGPCIPGCDRLFVNTEGIFYPCEKVSEASNVMQIGNIDEGFDKDHILSLLNIGKTTEELCKNCWAFRFCTLCAAYSDNLTSLSADQRQCYCNTVRNNIDRDLKDYCTLIELGYSFDEYKKPSVCLLR